MADKPRTINLKPDLDDINWKSANLANTTSNMTVLPRTKGVADFIGELFVNATTEMLLLWLKSKVEKTELPTRRRVNCCNGNVVCECFF